MSQTTKRNAEVAFEVDSNNVTSKKRARRRAAPKSYHRSTTDTPTKDQTSTPQPKPNVAPIGTSATLEVEDRAVLPVPTSDVVAKRKENEKLVRNKRRRASEKRPEEKNAWPKRQKHGPSSWDISSASGGTFIDHDPILTANGQYLVLPTKSHVHIYSTSTSLLVRSMSFKDKGIISCCSISADDPNALFTVTTKGSLAKHDLTTGNRVGIWKIGSGIVSMTSVCADKTGERVLVSRSKGGQDDELSLYLLHSGGLKNSTILLQNQKLRHVVASHDASVIVVCGTNEVNIAVRQGDASKYNWYKFLVPGRIGSFDVRTPANDSKKKAAVDVVVGLENGAIFVYQDVLLSTKNAKGMQLDLSGRKLHWHRNQVRSVKWSRDGNYIISGGDETVLVIWQLETNQEQFLPHLSTSILNLTVSSSGAHYAIRLGDNSVMVLSTADLIPSTNVAGLLPGGMSLQLHPTQSRLLAAGSIRPAKNTAATHLQTYDIDTCLQLSRQALTRNVTTAINVSPHGHPLQEPDVTHLKISFDGQWLATVDKWSRDHSDMQALYLKEDLGAKHAEITLRFWSWNASEDSWDMATRIDEAHTAGQFSILDLASNPTVSEFATMGEDGFIKIWKPRKRLRDSVPVRTMAGVALSTWACSCSVQVENTGNIQGVLAYSQDASMVTASWSHKQRHIHLVDPRSGKLFMSLPNLVGEGSASIAVMGRYLLCLSSSLRVFDLISLQTTFAMDLNQHRGSFLSINSHANVFAVGLNLSERQSVVSVFNLENLDQGSVNDSQLSGQIRALLAKFQGFVIVDDDCRIRKLMPLGSIPVVASTDTNENVVGKSLEDVFGREKLIVNGSQKLIEDGEVSHDLARLFSTTTTAGQPGVGEMFELVSRALSVAQVQVSA